VSPFQIKLLRGRSRTPVSVEPRLGTERWSRSKPNVGLASRTSASQDLAHPSIINSGLSASATAYYHADGNGNITCLIYPSQMIAAKYLYDPYGNTLAQYGSLADANIYRFSSKEWNANSGLYYYFYRFYDPNMQRWLNRDPLGEEGGINLCGFVENNPISHVDSAGLCNISIRCGPYAISGVTLGNHCGVVAPNGVEYGIGGAGTSGGIIGPEKTPPVYPNPTKPLPSPGKKGPNQTGYPVSCPNSSCDAVQACIANYNATVTPPPYNALGPNSDTYAHNMLSACGCSVDPIPQPPYYVCGGEGGVGPITVPRPPTTTPPGTVAWNYGF
jgi:RHS repeat-associated protein